MVGNLVNGMATGAAPEREDLCVKHRSETLGCVRA